MDSSQIGADAAVTLKDVQTQLGVSRATAFRVLKKEAFFTSINQKGQYHIKGKLLKFGEGGLAKHEGVIYSQHGNLLQTIIHLIEASTTGITVSEINQLVGTKTHIQCVNLARDKQVLRKKDAGVFRYFSFDQQIRHKQIESRSSEIAASSEIESIDLPDEDLKETIDVLVTCINNPKLEASPKSIALSLTRRGREIRTARVASILGKYSIVKKSF
jgi:hypothetical protein